VTAQPCEHRIAVRPAGSVVGLTADDPRRLARDPGADTRRADAIADAPAIAR
jgi:hypothetical protein